MQEWYVYLVRCNDDSLYCGITTSIERRIRQHNGEIAGGAKYTRAKRPVTLCTYATCKDKSSAASLEARIRRLPRLKKIDILKNYSLEE